MGPTNIALVKLFEADQRMRAAQARLEAASRDVRVQERRVSDLVEKHRLASATLMEARAKAGQVELDLKSREAHIEKLRLQQQQAKTNKEYQAFLVEINTEKVDKAKIEDELIKLMEQVERGQKQLAELASQLEAERSKLASLREGISDKLAALQAEVEALRVPRDEARKAVPPKALEIYDRLAEHHDGEALAPIAKPDPRREEYICSACNMELVTDVYNKLHSRDELVFCPSCRRILYIPQDLPPEAAVHRKKPPKTSRPRKPRQIAAAPRRGENAVDVLNSMTPPPEPETSSEAADHPDQGVQPDHPQQEASDSAEVTVWAGSSGGESPGPSGSSDSDATPGAS
ncbi:zinc ribbon domain-containing protein [Fontivita pretiosa]|uniref:zinc ribbon domain-containing protein n=1 Tax=Fontivita pretiosa TaxID=2989684 RepID=UPI003D16CA05